MHCTPRGHGNVQSINGDHADALNANGSETRLTAISIRSHLIDLNI